MFTDDDDYDDAEPVPDDVQMDDATAVKVPSVESRLSAIAAAFRYSTKSKKKKPSRRSAKIDPNDRPPPRKSTIPVLSVCRKASKF